MLRLSSLRLVAARVDAGQYEVAEGHVRVDPFKLEDIIDECLEAFVVEVADLLESEELSEEL